MGTKIDLMKENKRRITELQNVFYVSTYDQRDETRLCLSSLFSLLSVFTLYLT